MKSIALNFLKTVLYVAAAFGVTTFCAQAKSTADPDCTPLGTAPVVKILYGPNKGNKSPLLKFVFYSHDFPSYTTKLGGTAPNSKSSFEQRYNHCIAPKLVVTTDKGAPVGITNYKNCMFYLKGRNVTGKDMLQFLFADIPYSRLSCQVVKYAPS